MIKRFICWAWGCKVIKTDRYMEMGVYFTHYKLIIICRRCGKEMFK